MPLFKALTSFPQRLFVIAAVAVSAGCASIPAEQLDPRDPYESFNRSMYTFNDGLDTMFLKPIATGYDFVLPSFAKTGVTNFFDNIADLPIAVNQALQGKGHNALDDLTRFLFNSTFGLLGFVDFASNMMDLPRHNEDFGQTLGVWGFDSGSYLVVPFFGPRTTRDTWGLGGDIVLDPLFVIRDNATYWGLVITRVVNDRANLLAAERVLDAAALDPYVFLRESYLQQRQNLLYDGNPPEPEFDEDFLEELGQPEDVAPEEADALMPAGEPES